MIFTSLNFLVFFLVTYGLYVCLSHRYQNVLLLVASYVFYGCWDWRFLSLICLSTLVDYVCGIKIHEAEAPLVRRRFVAISVIANLGILFVFKYFGFFSVSLASLLSAWGIEADVSFLNIVLPVGISFYTFQTMSYTIDIYRGQLAPTRDLLNFAVFVSFFPQLVAGPIERARNLLPQVEKPRSVTYDQLREGGWLLLLGYFKKTVVADNMAVFTEPLFNNPESASGLSIILGVYAFAFQIYGDFSGYSDIARGLAKLMGFDLMVNFRMPYLATNPQEFWTRWHISLSSWLRDYLYIPLGGSRQSVLATYRNLMLTMVLGGLWHGAAWHFVAWGFYQGAILILHRSLEPVLSQLTPTGKRQQRIWRIVCTIGFFQLTCVGWLIFAVQDLRHVPILLHHIFAPFSLNGKVTLVTIVIFCVPVLIFNIMKEYHHDMSVVKRLPRSFRLVVYSLLFAAILCCGVIEGREFIYFQF